MASDLAWAIGIIVFVLICGGVLLALFLGDDDSGFW